MSEYKVINRFQEKNHDGHVYEPGDTYPVEGKKLVKTRAEFLTKVHKEYGVAFLEEVEGEKKSSSTAKIEPKTVKKEAENGEKSDE